MKILLIENDPILNGTIADFLKFKGNELTSLDRDGNTIEVIDNTIFDLFIIDISEPQIDGLEIVKYIRQKDIETPIIMITASMELKSIKSAFKNGCDNYIKKPFYLEELEIMIDKLMNKPSEQKSPYVQKESSGEIKSSKTTSNEISDVSSASGEIDKDVLIKELQKYVDIIEDKGHKKRRQDSLNDEFYWFVLYDTYDEDIKRKVFSYYKSIAQSSEDFRYIAEKYESLLKDTDNAIKMFKIAEQKIENYDDASSMAEAVANYYDKDWARSVYKKAYQYAIKCKDESELKDLAAGVSVDYTLGDKTWARELFKEALDKPSNFEGLISIIEGIEYNLEDKDWATELLKEAESSIDSFNDSLLLAESLILMDIDDAIEWAIETYKKTQTYCSEIFHYIQLAKSLLDYSDLNVKDWALTIYQEAEQKSQSSEDYLELASSIYDHFKGNDWVIELLKKAEKSAKSSDELSKIIDALNFLEVNEDGIDNLIEGNWKQAILEKAIKQCENFDNYNNLIYSINGDKLVTKVIQLAIENIENDDDKEAIADTVENCLEDDSWAKDIRKSSIEQLKKEPLQKTIY